MNVKRIRTTLWLTALAFTAGAAAIVAFHFTPRELAPPGGGPTEPSIVETELPAVARAPQADPAALQQLAGRDYRQRLFDPPVVEPPPPTPKPVPPVQLISTILRPGGEASAWVIDGQATRKILIGDTVGPDNNPATVTGIEPDQLVLDHEGREAHITRDAGGGRRR